MLICYIFIFRFAQHTAQELRKLEISPMPDVIGNSHITQSGPDFEDTESDKNSEESEISLEELRKQRQSVFSIHSLAITFNHTTGELRRKLKARQKEIRAAKTVLIIFLSFVICNAPIFVTSWWSVKIGREKVDTKTKLVLLNLSFVQVMVNPLVYFFRLDDFKKARRKVKRYGTTIIRKSIRSNSMPQSTLNTPSFNNNLPSSNNERRVTVI